MPDVREGHVTVDARPVLVGMNNPYGADPRYALYPLPERATGHCLLELLRLFAPEVTRNQYCEGFDRRNLLTGSWDQARAREAAGVMREELWGRQVVFLGAAVRDAFGLTKKPYGSLAWQKLDALFSADSCWTYAHWLPHPSGLNQFYNSHENRMIAARLLERLYGGERGLLLVS